MYEPLNLGLYNCLVRRFTHVEIANVQEPFTPGHSGEYYRVSCPFCDDTRQRLWINHMFNVVDPSNGDDRIFLAICYNEGCIDTREIQLKLVDMIYPFGYRRRRYLEKQRQQQESLPLWRPPQFPTFDSPAQLPPCFSLAESISLPAHQYLVGRGFDPTEIADRWEVGFSLLSPNTRPRLFQQLVIPIYDFKTSILSAAVRFPSQGDKYLAGWVARKTSEDSAGPKYLFMKDLRKSSLLYGLPQAVQTQGPIIVVEGVTDVWRAGSNAVATLGKSLSLDQTNKLVQYFAGRPIIVMYDVDAIEDSTNAVAAIRSARSKYGDRAPLLQSLPPEGSADVGESSREAVWDRIREACAPAGISVAIGTEVGEQRLPFPS